MTIRSATVLDAARLSQIYGYYVENTAISFEYVPPSAQEFEKRIAKTLEHYPYLVIEDGGEILGYAYAGAMGSREAYKFCAELSIYIDKSARRCGCGRLLYNALEEKLLDMGIVNLYAKVVVPQQDDPYVTKDSGLFHQRMGYTPAGTLSKCGYKFGRWYDLVYFEKSIAEHK